jgi:hypothetical protein
MISSQIIFVRMQVLVGPELRWIEQQFPKLLTQSNLVIPPSGLVVEIQDVRRADVGSEENKGAEAEA